jgi:mono/diheme cytochrome c family protein
VTKIRVLLIGGTVALALLLGACGGDDDEGASGGGGGGGIGHDVYRQSCASCHGQDGEGGIGPQLGDGAVAEAYPDIADQIAVITNGRGNMPSFESQLTPEQIEAVATFEREALGQ